MTSYVKTIKVNDVEYHIFKTYRKLFKIKHYVFYAMTQNNVYFPLWFGDIGKLIKEIKFQNQ